MNPIEISDIPKIKNPIIGFIDSFNRKGYFHKIDYSQDLWMAFSLEQGVNGGNSYGAKSTTLVNLCKSLDGFSYFIFDREIELFAWLAGREEPKQEKVFPGLSKPLSYNEWVKNNFLNLKV